MTTVSFITLNVQGLRAVANRSTLFSWLNCVKADVVCLQETHSISPEEFTSWVATETSNGNNFNRYAAISSPGSVRSAGVAILYTPFFKLEEVVVCHAGRGLLARFSSASCDTSPIQVINIYGPNQRKPGDEFFASLMSNVDPSLPTILGGDFNTVVDPALDRSGCNASSYWAYNWPRSLALFTSVLDLVDAWRQVYPTRLEYTWHRPNGTQSSRLDMFWLSSSLMEHVTQVGIFPFFRSDHAYVYLRLRIPMLPSRGPGVWKFNTSLLRNDDYKLRFAEFWSAWQKEKPSFPSLSCWWDAGKQRIKHLSRHFSRQLAREKKARILQLENTLRGLQQRQSQGDDVLSHLQRVKVELQREHANRAEGARIRSREQWAEEGETSTSYFFRQEKIKAVRRTFSGIRNAGGVVVRSISAIVRVWCLFYLQLFTATLLVPSDQDFFLGCLRRKLSPADARLCEGFVTVEECENALKQMKTNKSPGIDGLPYEFYSCFWTLLGNDLVAVFNSSFSSGRLSFTQRTGLITLLFKKGDKLNTANWRPISLLCTDYKILAKVLTNRLLSVISTVVAPDQVCGVPGRLSSEHLRLLKDIVDHAHSSDVPTAVLSLDQEKAFDRVDWRFMMRVLETMNFGPSFCSWVRLLYTTLFSSVLVNNHVSELFPVTRGVRQGCPLSPLLYILVAETIGSAIRQCPAIDGFLLPDGSRRKLFQYADDTTVVVSSDTSLLALFSLFEKYERATGARLNVAKSHGLLLGAWRSRLDMPISLDWSNVSIPVLGCDLGPSVEPNWDVLVGQFQDQLALWQSRELSFHGRAMIANVLGLSLFWYKASIFAVPANIITRINKLLFPFVWNRKTEYLARATVTQAVPCGGLGVVDFRRKVASLRSLWLRRYLSPDHDHSWTVYFDLSVSMVFPESTASSLFTRPVIPQYLIRKLPPFYASLLHTWVELGGTRVAQMWVIPRPNLDPLPVAELTARLTYSFLSCQHRAEHRAVEKFRALGIGVDWSHVWRSLSLWRFVRSVRDTAWLSFHGVLPTADRLVRFGMAVDPLCFCGQPETLLHLFVDCPSSVHVMQWFLSQVHKVVFPFVLSRSHILFGFTPSDRLPLVFSALLGVLRHHIWLARNRYRFDHIRVTPADTLRKAKSTFRFLLRMHQRHCPRYTFEREWLANGVIGNLTANDYLQFACDLDN